MSSESVLGLVLGLLVLIGIVSVILYKDRSIPATEQINDPKVSMEWEERAKKAREDFGLEQIRSVSGKWAANVAGLLGVLSTVAFVAGPSALKDDVGGGEAILAAALVLVAAGTAVVATLLGGLAEQGTPVWRESLDGSKYRTLIKTRARRAIRQLYWSRGLTVVALALVILATGVAWMTALTNGEKPSPINVIVTGTPAAHCGELVQVRGTLSVSSEATAFPIPSNAQVVPVDSCPR
jgi:hypothetical protein